MKSIGIKRLEKLATTHRYGNITLVLPNHKKIQFKGELAPDLSVTWTLKNWSVVFAVFCSGDIGLGYSYIKGQWDTSDLTQLITILALNEDHHYNFNPLFSKFHAFLDRFYQNSIEGSQKNIQSHYDVGNDFYRLWLDQQMNYSSALFENASDSLYQAQQNKLQRILNQFPDHTKNILEIGCGWGAFMELAEQRGIKVKGLTLSKEQLAHCNKRDLSHGSLACLQDYRHETNQYQGIVSIEMFEAVGKKYWPTYFHKVAQCLTPDGVAVIQTIHLDEHPNASAYEKNSDFIRRFVFPGGYLPTTEQFIAAAEQAGLKVEERFGFGESYARTLELWHEAMIANKEEILATGRSEEMLRCWEFYLQYCIVGFRTKKCNVSQFVMKHST